MMEPLLRVRDRVSRLKGMEPPEIRHRVKQALRVGVDRAAGTIGAEPSAGTTVSARIRRMVSAEGETASDDVIALRYLKRVVAPRFYLPARRDGWQSLHGTFDDLLPGAIPRSIAAAESVLDGAVPLLGHGPVPIEGNVDWHRDPLTDARWPVRFWADYDLVAEDNPADPKVIHELNRHQFLPRLAIAHAITGRDRFAHHAVRHVESWIEQNPPGIGVNWTSSLEIALRAISWLWTLFPLVAFDAVEPATAGRWLSSLRAHLRHVSRYPSVYSSPNTHLLGEATALFLGGVLFAELDEAEAWRRQGRRFLVQEIERQVLPDGAHAELSPYYHCYSLDFYLQALALARCTGASLAAEVDDGVLRQARFLAHITRRDGTIPLLGDDDGGRALVLDRQDYRSFTDGISSAAALLESPELAAAAGGLHAETLWLLGAASGGELESLESRRATPGRAAVAATTESACFPDAGYSIQRAGDAHLVFDHGGLGRLGGGHAHADALSITLHCGETEMLVDPGTFAYNLAPEWRDHFRSTRAHNTLVIDGADQAVPGGTFGWSSELTARIRGRRTWRGLEMIEAEHDGYRRLPEPVTHRRRVLLVDGEYWLIFDDVRGSGHHCYDLYYHLHPATEPGTAQPEELDDRLAGLSRLSVPGHGDTLGLWVAASHPLESRVDRGRTEPPAGWVSRCYGHRAEAPVLRARMHTAASAGLVSALVPDPGDVAVRIGDRASDESAIALQLDRGHATDLALLAPDGAEMAVNGIEATAELVWVQMVDGEPRRLLARHAKRIAWNDTVLLDRENPSPWFEWARTDENGS